MKHHRIVLCFVILASAISACHTPASEERATDDLDRYLEQVFPADEPGGAILIMKGDSILFSQGYGLADLGTKEKVTPQTLFNTGSVSKTFVANAILVLHHEGKLSLEDSLLKYFPEFKDPAIASRVKIKHLLNHTSGLPDIRRVWDDTVFYLTARDYENWYPVTQAESLTFEPGAEFQYSNPAYNGLALIVEKVSGMKWQAFIKQRIMNPAGMKTSTITDGPHPESGVAHAYVKMNNGSWAEDDYGEEPTFAAAGNGGVWSSVEELALYELALRRGTFLPTDVVSDSRRVKRFENWTAKARSVSGWSWYAPNIGWSWFIDTTRGIELIGHTGSQGGFRANYVSIPQEDVFFAVLCNSPRDIQSISDRVIDWLETKDWLN